MLSCSVLSRMHARPAISLRTPSRWPRPAALLASRPPLYAAHLRTSGRPAPWARSHSGGDEPAELSDEQLLERLEEPEEGVPEESMDLDEGEGAGCARRGCGRASLACPPALYQVPSLARPPPAREEPAASTQVSRPADCPAPRAPALAEEIDEMILGEGFLDTSEEEDDEGETLAGLGMGGLAAPSRRGRAARSLEEDEDLGDLDSLIAAVAREGGLEGGC